MQNDVSITPAIATSDGFYVTAYPEPADWTKLELKNGAYWHRDGGVGSTL
ncbi:MAG: hypothetical protein ABW080_06465 [Candidatus Thiodiazotropha sp.]